VAEVELKATGWLPHSVRGFVSGSRIADKYANVSWAHFACW
jgi:hypothetical protein